MPIPPLGSLYITNYQGIAWSQPIPGGTVYPQQNTGPFGYPGNQILMQEPGQGLWTSGCGHWWDCIQVFRDYDSDAQQSAAVLCCPLCSFLIRVVEPYELIEDPIQYMILIP
jgi:hypothetical protein